MTKIFDHITIIISFISILACLSFGQENIDTVKFDNYIQKSYEQWGEPGLAIAIVDNEKIIWSKGYGYTDCIKKENKVDNNTLFHIASNSKSFTASAISLILNKYRISWDTPIITFLPDFKVYDSTISNKINITDVLSHRVGYKTFSGDLLWYGTKYRRDEIIDHLRYLPLMYSYRSHFGYSNIMYLVGGEIINKITSHTWDTYVKYMLFYQLEMSNTFTSLNDLSGKNNVALPHIYTNKNQTIQVNYVDWNNIAPAGSIYSNINDISHWMNMWLNNGIYKGNRILDTVSILKMTSIVTPIEISENEKILFSNISDKGYGLGWYIFNYKNNKIIEHSGGAVGMVSQITLIPGKNIGLIALTNSNNALPVSLNYYFLDMILDTNSKDWSYIFYESRNLVNQFIENKIKYTIDSLKTLKSDIVPVQQISGVYSSKLYGDVIIKEQNDSIICDFVPSNVHKGLLKAINHNYYTIEMINDPSLPLGIVEFDIDSSDNVIRMDIDIPNPDFDFKELNLIKIN